GTFTPLVHAHAGRTQGQAQRQFFRCGFASTTNLRVLAALCAREFMSKKKLPKSRFVLEERNGVVVASLLDEHDMSLQHTIHGMPHPRVRAPRRKKDQTIEDSIFMASMFHQSQEEFLRKNIKGINQEINKHVQEIRKTLKRMQSLTHYVVTAQEILDESEQST
ncbi:hypothetical protein, partial [Microbulbifer halophilus]